MWLGQQTAWPSPLRTSTRALPVACGRGDDTLPVLRLELRGKLCKILSFTNPVESALDKVRNSKP